MSHTDNDDDGKNFVCSLYQKEMNIFQLYPSSFDGFLLYEAA